MTAPRDGAQGVACALRGAAKAQPEEIVLTGHAQTRIEAQIAMALESVDHRGGMRHALPQQELHCGVAREGEDCGLAIYGCCRALRLLGAEVRQTIEPGGSVIVPDVAEVEFAVPKGAERGREMIGLPGVVRVEEGDVPAGGIHGGKARVARRGRARVRLPDDPGAEGGRKLDRCKLRLGRGRRPVIDDENLHRASIEALLSGDGAQRGGQYAGLALEIGDHDRDCGSAGRMRIADGRAGPLGSRSFGYRSWLSGLGAVHKGPPNPTVAGSRGTTCEEIPRARPGYGCRRLLPARRGTRRPGRGESGLGSSESPRQPRHSTGRS